MAGGTAGSQGYAMVSDHNQGVRMTRRRNIYLGSALALPVAALAVAGCGGGGSNGNQSAAGAKPPTSHVRVATIDVRATSLGRTLVDSQGRTLYLFEKDKGSSSTCSGACAAAWPPVMTSGRPMAGAGARQADLGTTRRSDGSTEVTYNGHPLYYYAGDQSPGDTNGQGVKGFGAPWYVLSPTGKKIDND